MKPSAAFLKLFSCACFASIHGIVRFLLHAPQTELSVNGILFFQYCFGLVFLLPWLIQQKMVKFKTPYFHWHLLRILCAVGGLGLFYLTLKHLPLAQSVALNFLSPLLGLLGAKILLKEKLPPTLTFSLIISFVGVGCILYPEWQRLQHISLQWVLILPVLAALLLAGSKLLTRHLGVLGEDPRLLTAYLLFFSIIVALVPALFDWAWPQAKHWPWLIMLGALSSLAHLSFSKAYQLASVSYLTPFGFSKFFLSALIGYGVFHERPNNNLTWLGIGLILLAVIAASRQKKAYHLLK
jgi:drug/metabolite transporter (DMT)-like permease